jgi:hypothetical protein
MKILLDSRYYIDNELYGFRLVDTMARKAKDKDTGEIGYIDYVVGYYSTPARAMQRYVTTYLNNTLDVVTMREYIDAYESAIERVAGLLPRV